MAELGCMSPQMSCLAKSQDIIDWKNFIEGRLSRHFFDVQNEYLALGNHRINAEQWTRQFTSKILHITHSQWIFRNFTLHDKQKGWLRRKELHDIMVKIDQLRETDIDDIPESSRFLLEMDYDNLMKSNIHNKMYWVVATEAAIKAGQRRANSDVRSRTQLKRRQQRPTRERLGVIDVEKKIKSDRRACTAIRRGGATGSSHSNAVISTPSKRKSLCSTSGVMARTNKRYKPGD